MKPTGEAVWKALMNDPEHACLPDPVKAAIRPHMEKLPDVLEDMLDLPVTFANLVNARLRIFKYWIESDYINALVDAMPDSSIGLIFDRDGLREMQSSLVESLIAIHQTIADDPASFLSGFGLSDEAFLLNRHTGLAGEAREMYTQGTLTIGDLLARQPNILVSEKN